MDEFTGRMERGLDGDTATPIRYSSPPPRDEDDITTFLVQGRGLGRFEPRHTPPDICAAQDLALRKDLVLEAAAKAAKLPRRDSGVNTEVLPDVKGSVAELPDRATKQKLSPPKLVLRPPKAPAKFEAPLKSPTSPAKNVSTAPMPILTVRPATPPSEETRVSVTSSIASSMSPERQTTSRRRSARRAVRDDLTIDGTPVLAAQIQPVQVKQYRDAKGKWYEVIEDGRPAWAVEERTVTKGSSAGRRESTYRRNRGS